MVRGSREIGRPRFCWSCREKDGYFSPDSTLTIVESCPVCVENGQRVSL
jgi:hypothetical protein